jgi:L-alanine-DL-glutamate epimerase-like enolase superfamily enzyme
VTGTPIRDVEVLTLRASVDAADLDGSSETVVVRVIDEAGESGIGEADAPAAAVRELVLMEDLHAWSKGLRSLLIGRDPYEVAALYDEAYQATIYHGRRGLGIHALSAVDIALHDLVGKQLGRPAYQLLGGARRSVLSPYATIYPGAVKERSLAEMMSAISALFETALGLGFRALKMEVLFYELVSDRQLVDCIREGRRILGDEIVMLVDFGYRWQSWRDALWTLRRLEDCDIYLVEAALQHDDLEGHARLAERIEPRLGGAEFAATVHECHEWLVRGRVDVLQPDVNRCGGLTELRRIADLASTYGASVIPHGWKTGITAAAARHFQAATLNSPYVEMFAPDLFPSPLRRELVDGEPTIHEGTVPLPSAPGLGVTLNNDALTRYAVN